MMNPPTYLPVARRQLAWERICEARREGRKPRFLTFRCLLTAPLTTNNHATPRRLPASPRSARPTDRPPERGAAVALPEFLNHRRKEGREERGDKDLEGLRPSAWKFVDCSWRSWRCCPSVGRLGERQNVVGMHTYSRSYPLNQPSNQPPVGERTGTKISSSFTALSRSLTACNTRASLLGGKGRKKEGCAGQLKTSLPSFLL